MLKTLLITNCFLLAVLMVYVLASTILYALFLSVGSVSIGYLVLRLAYPEVRLMQQRKKFAYSFATGAGLFAIALVFDAFFGYPLFQGHYYTSLFVLCVSLLFVFKALSSLASPAEMLIALPTPAFMGRTVNVRKMRDIKKRVLEAEAAHSAPLVPSAPSTSGQRRAYARSGGFKMPSLPVLFSNGKKISKDSEGSKPLGDAPKPRELTVEEQAESFADQLKLEAPPAPSKAGGNEGVPRWRRRKKLQDDSPEMQAFLGAVQEAYAEKHGEATVPKRKEKAKKKDDMKLLMQDVYSQLEDSKSAGVASSLIVKDEAPVVQPKAKQEEASSEGVTMSDLFGSTAPKQPVPKQAQGGDLFNQLGAIAGGDALQAPSVKEEASSEFVKVKAEKGMGCPNCGAKNTRVVFCPYCGQGFCANCAPSITPGASSFSYVCPKCGESVTVKKKAN